MAYPPALQVEAYNLWLHGATLYKVAKELNIAKTTVTGWQQKHNWVLKKEEQLRKAESLVALRFEKKIVKGAELYFDFSVKIIEICNQRVVDLLKKEHPPFEELAEITKDAQRGAAIYKAVMPNASEILVKQLISMLSNANKEVKGVEKW